MWKDIQKPWQVAFELGWESLKKKGSIPIGAVITDANMNVISSGRNRLYESTTKNPKVSHAETEAMQDLDVSTFPDVYEYTLFACMEPCPMCMGAIVMSNLRKLRVAARDSYCGAVHFCDDDPYIKSKNIQVSFELGLLETIQLTLQAYFEIKRQNGEMSRVALIFEKDNPVAVRIAKSFYDNGYLMDALKNDMSFGDVFDQIVERI